MSREKPKDQVSVKLEPELKAAVAQAAKVEHRTVSQQIRHYVACAVAQQQAA